MKKIFIVVSILSLFVLVGCDEEYKQPTIKQDGEDISFWTDEQTGCEYILYSRKVSYAGMGGVTPRLDSDGVQICN